MRCVLGSAAIPAALLVAGCDADSTPIAPAAVSMPGPTPHPPVVTWMRGGSLCVDGWQSPSIGERGACSWHHGVGARFVASNGDVLICDKDETHPPTTYEEQFRQLSQSRALSCTPNH